MNVLKPVFFLLLCLIVFSCSKESGVNPNLDGKNSSDKDFQLNCIYPISGVAQLNALPGTVTNNELIVNGVIRQYKVYLPASYNQKRNYPVLYKFHASGQTANNVVNTLDWEDVADQEKFIVIFPQAKTYLLTNGQIKTHWHTAINTGNFSQATPPHDDVAFFNAMHNSVKKHLRVDCQRIYAVGFSNGGTFVKTRCRVELGSVFAATCSVGLIGGNMPSPPSGLFSPHFEVCGNNDSFAKSGCNTFPRLPIHPTSIQYHACIMLRIHDFRTDNGLSSTFTTNSNIISGRRETSFTFANSSLGQNTEYEFRMLQNQNHTFPGSPFDTYPIDYEPIIWDWVKRFTL